MPVSPEPVKEEPAGTLYPGRPPSLPVSPEPGKDEPAYALYPGRPPSLPVSPRKVEAGKIPPGRAGKIPPTSSCRARRRVQGPIGPVGGTRFALRPPTTSEAPATSCPCKTPTGGGASTFRRASCAKEAARQSPQHTAITQGAGATRSTSAFSASKCMLTPGRKETRATNSRQPTSLVSCDLVKNSSTS